MGIKDFRAFLKGQGTTAVTTLQMTAFRGTRIAIDGNLVMYDRMSGANGSAYENLDLKNDPRATPDSKELTNIWLKLLIDFLLKLCSYGITPVMIFDGKHRIEKAAIQKVRKDKKDKQKNDVKKIVDSLESVMPHLRSDGDVHELMKKKKNILYITQEQTILFKNILNYIGIPVINAAADGEELCCTLSHFGKVSAVYSKDADCAIFGTAISITGINKLSRAPNQTFDVILYDRIVSKLDITREILIDMCILHGCDYSPGIRGYGLITSMKKLRIYGCIDNITPSEIFPEDFSLEAARDSFRIKSIVESLGEAHEGKLPSLNINKASLSNFATRAFLENYDLGRYINRFMSAYENITVFTDRGAEYILPEGRLIPRKEGDILIKRPEVVETPEIIKRDFTSVPIVNPIKDMLIFN
jgi:flap endonuclease-1